MPGVLKASVFQLQVIKCFSVKVDWLVFVLYGGIVLKFEYLAYLQFHIFSIYFSIMPFKSLKQMLNRTDYTDLNILFSL